LTISNTEQTVVVTHGVFKTPHKPLNPEDNHQQFRHYQSPPQDSSPDRTALFNNAQILQEKKADTSVSSFS
jgi:hypothetical protein